MKIYTLFLFLLVTTFLQAQDPNHFVIGEKQFSNTDIYTLLYDDGTDILYAGTSEGLYVYKQNIFVKLKGPENQIGNSIFQLNQDNHGNIYCCNLNGQIFKVMNNDFELFYEVSSELMTNDFSYFIDAQNNLVIGCKSVIKIHTASKKETYIYNSLKDSASKNIDVVGGFSQLFDKSICFEVYIKSDKSQHYVYKKGKLIKSETLGSNRCFFSLNSTVFTVSGRGETIGSRINFQTKVKFNEALFYINNNRILGLDKQKGARIIKLKGDTFVEEQHFFDKEFLSTAFINKNGTFFLGTFGRGVMIIPNLKVQSHYNSDELLLGIDVSLSNELFLSTRSGKVFLSSLENQIDKVNISVDQVFHIPKIKGFNNQVVFSGVNGLGNLKDVCVLDENSFLLSSPYGIYIYSLKEPKYFNKLKYNFFGEHLYGLLNGTARSNSVAWSFKDSVVYYSNNLGVYLKEWNSLEEEAVLYKGKAFLSNDLKYDNNQLVCATKENGILFFRDKENVEQLSEKNGLKSNAVKKIKISNNLLYALTEKGIQVYNLLTKQFLGIGVIEGVVNNTVNNFAVSNDKLWLLEKHKYYAIDIATILKKDLIANLYIDSITVNGRVVSDNKNKEFDYSQNAFNFYFDYRDVETKHETEISYTLEGFYEDWKTVLSSENKIEFQYLPVGEYTFKIKGVYRNQSTKIFKYEFEIFPPFWKRWWFYIGLFIFTVLLVSLIARIRLQRVSKKNKEILEKEILSKELAESKLKALRSQMNPHFIFNSLNSIQNLVLQKDTNKSYDYLVLFAELVRSALDYSEQEFIAIEKELEFLNVYLELEKLRFGNDFEFKIEYKGSLDVKVPSLVVQPFIENALLHGLLHKKGKKKLTIVFAVDKELTCVIIDNGVGRKKAKEIKDRQNISYESFSTGAIKKRMEILSQQFNMDATFFYEDLLEKGNVSGTKVSIVLPFKSF
ncbi:MAG: histidine kinase [Flavobacteriales bacterium]|nr:histidine kinase [Flavobacteriales bacterium]